MVIFGSSLGIALINLLYTIHFKQIKSYRVYFWFPPFSAIAIVLLSLCMLRDVIVDCLKLFRKQYGE